MDGRFFLKRHVTEIVQNAAVMHNWERFLTPKQSINYSNI